MIWGHRTEVYCQLPLLGLRNAALVELAGLRAAPPLAPPTCLGNTSRVTSCKLHLKASFAFRAMTLMEVKQMSKSKFFKLLCNRKPRIGVLAVFRVEQPKKVSLPCLMGNTHFQRREWSCEKNQKLFLLLLLHEKDSLLPWKRKSWALLNTL